MLSRLVNTSLLSTGRCGGPIWSEEGAGASQLPSGVVLGCWGQWVRRRAHRVQFCWSDGSSQLKTQPRILHSGLNYNFELYQDVEICGCLDNHNPLQGSPSLPSWVCGPLWVSYLPRQLLFSNWLGRTS